VLAVCALAPFVVLAAGQVHQISWITPIGRRTIEDVTVQQYFERSPPFALLSALVVAAAIVLWLCTSAQLGEANRQLLTLGVAWLVIPTALIVIWSALIHPIYTPRYLCFTAPALALSWGLHRRIRRQASPPSVFFACCSAELSSGATQPVRKVWNGLQPSGRSDHREGCAGDCLL
jgi:uncharacterized membrane protein